VNTTGRSHPAASSGCDVKETTHEADPEGVAVTEPRDAWNLDMGAGPIFEQIAKNVHQMLARGALRPGDKLPSARDLAALLSVNPNTIVHAYQQLEADGVIEKQRGLGTFVRDDAPVTGLKKDMLHQAAGVYAAECVQLEASLEEATRTLEEVWHDGVG
jgi:GntR family transcriptional regulator